jgi:hypothetical protein
MQLRGLVLALLGAFVVTVTAQTPMDIQPVKELKLTGSLGTCGYKPVSSETPFFARLDAKERTNDAAFGGNYTMHGKTGTYISWFGIVRGITPTALSNGDVTLLVQHHFFDGLSDCHIMLVA